MKLAARVLVGLFVVGWVGGVVYVRATGISGNGGLIVLLLVSAWLALAAVCVWKANGLWLAAAVVAPFPVAIITFIVWGLIVSSPETDSLQRLGEAFAAIYLAAGLGIVSSYLLLVIGAIWPSSRPRPTTPEPIGHTKPARVSRSWRLPAGRGAGALAAGSFLVVAGAVIALLLFLREGNRMASIVDDRGAIVAAQARAYSEGDLDQWLSFYAPDASLWNGAYTAGSRDALDNAQAFAAAHDQWTITAPCDKGVDQVVCPMRRRDVFHGPAGLAGAGVVTFTFSEDDKITAQRISPGPEVVFGPYDTFDMSFDRWLAAAHPDVHAQFGPRRFAAMPNAEDMPMALLYLFEFFEQSDAYPIHEHAP